MTTAKQPQLLWIWLLWLLLFFGGWLMLMLNPVLAGVMLGSSIALPVGILWVAPWVPPVLVKVSFAVFWAAFGIVHLARLDELSTATGDARKQGWQSFVAGLAAGVVGGLSIVALTGVGIDMLVYALLVLAFQVDPKIAIPTSVLAMAFNSVLGIAIKQGTIGIEAGVWENWLAAAPIVAIGAPLGAFVVSLIGRRITLLFVAVLCVSQFGWACYHERAALGLAGISVACVAVAICISALDRLRVWGRRQTAHVEGSEGRLPG